MEISTSIRYVGVNDHQIDLFEGQFEVPLGMAYNSYVILDEKIAVMDSVDAAFGEEWLTNIETVCGERTPDYLIIQHMEMDHSASLKLFMEKYPEAKVVSSKLAFTMMKALHGTDFPERQMVIMEGSKLELGSHTLNFIAAPSVHWPEVMMTYESSEKVLFSADGFGKFGANDVEDPEGWACEARRYYFGIVGKFGSNVQAVLKKAAALDIAMILPLHGPVLMEDLGTYLNYYQIWSSYEAESEGVMIAYTSVYGNTKKAVMKLQDILLAKGCPKVVVADLAREDTYECIEDAFRYGKLILASTTYNGGVFPKMREFIQHLTSRNYQKRTIGFMENGSWGPVAYKAMTALLEGGKDLTLLSEKVTIKIAMTEENVKEMEVLADAILK